MAEGNHRKVYMRGYFDGVAAREKEENMRESRFKAIFNNLSGIAQKVYAATPMNDQWTTSQIEAELKRKGHSIEFATIRQCLSQMIASGILSGSTKGRVTRVAVKESYRAPVEHELVESSAQERASAILPRDELPRDADSDDNETLDKDAPVSTTAIDKLTAISARARNIAASLASLAEDIDNAAIELDGEIAKVGEDADQLKQLKALLKGLA